MADLKNATELAEKKKALLKYLGDPNVSVIYNSERVDITKFNEKSIVRESVTFNR